MSYARRAAVLLAVAASTACARPTPGRRLAERSSGVERGESWVLESNGYAGTYVRVKRPGRVAITVAASGIADRGVPPRMNVVVADERRAFDVGPQAADYGLTADLPAGTFFVRIEYVNDEPRASRELWVHRVSVAGAEVLGLRSDADALDAANTYIAGYRRGPATVKVPGARPGALARVRLARHAFNFGVNIPFAVNRMIPVEPPPPGSDAALYQKMVLDHFNTVVLSNGGKWVYQEPVRDRVDMSYVDRFLDFAAQHGLRARMHTMLWDTEQQPAWVVSQDPGNPGLLTRAKNGDEQAKAELTGEIDERVDYYVRQRARRYLELDVVNESLHRVRYWQVYGAAGFADLFNKTARAVRAGGGQTRLYLNEYNLLQSSVDPLGGGSDPYANWYRRHAEEILRAGGAVDGLGVQYYVDGRLPAVIGSRAHSPARMAAALQNLSTTGLRISMTEFSVNAGEAAPERAADILEETMRIVFGTPQADSFLIWAIWPRAAAPPVPFSVMFDADGHPTATGRRYEALMREWSTDLTLPVATDGSVTFTGFFGDYDVAVEGRRGHISLVKGRSQYTADMTVAAAP